MTKKPKARKCATPTCRNKVKHAKKCSTCRVRECRKKDPVKYCWQTLKDNAKRRNKVFAIRLEFFRKWCIKTKYIAGKGRANHHYTIDRVLNDRGYTEDNIQKLTGLENRQKYTKLIFDWRYPELTKHVAV